MSNPADRVTRAAAVSPFRLPPPLWLVAGVAVCLCCPWAGDDADHERAMVHTRSTGHPTVSLVPTGPAVAR